MNIFYPSPAAKIASIVKAILVIENDFVISPFSLPLFANSTPTLLFTTAPVCLGSNRSNLILFGQTVIPEQLLIKDSFKLVAYFLHPYALDGLFNISIRELTDNPVDLSDFTGTYDLQDKLQNCPSTNDMLQVLNDYLLKQYTNDRQKDRKLTYAARIIGQRSDKNVLKTVQQELNLTERTFQRLFETKIGISPNQFRRVGQFNRAFQQVNKGNFIDFSTVAFENGYSDQSHFIRAFKEFTNITPTTYLLSRPQI